MKNEYCQQIANLCDELEKSIDDSVNYKSDAVIRWALFEIKIQATKIDNALNRK